MAAEPTVAVLAPSVLMSITIEESRDPAWQEIHLHAAGQGVWVARMLANLGERPVVCAPLGGESGRALQGLAREWQIKLDTVTTQEPSPAYVHDRRSGRREELARSPVARLNRHEVDELYGRMLERSLATGVCVVTGRIAGDVVPTDFYRRLGADLAEAGVQVVGDLHGEELHAFLEAGTLRWLKVSDDDLAEDGQHHARSDDTAFAAIRDLEDLGAQAVVLSRGDRPTLATCNGRRYRIDGPELQVVDHSGAGDSMTAALAASVVRELTAEDALRLAWAAGAANVVRHGLGSASSDLIDTLTHRVRVTVVEEP